MAGCRLAFLVLTLFAPAALFSELAAAQQSATRSSTTLEDQASPSASERPVFFGHNVTQSSDVLKEGKWTLGNYAIATGVTDSVMIATSPWIWVSYNTANVHLKWVPLKNENTRAGLFFSYFQSYDSAPLVGAPNSSESSSCPPGRPCRNSASSFQANTGLNRYQWQSASLHLIASHRFAPWVESHANIKGSTYLNDELPYSLRMDPGSDSIRDQLDLTTLTTFRLGSENLRASLEAGALGLNYIDPYFHTGLSFAYLSESWLVQLGASYTVQFNEMFQASGWEPGRYDNRIHTTESGVLYTNRYLQTALHPEVQIQYLF